MTSDREILADRLTELVDMAERMSAIVKHGLADSEAHEMARAIRAAGELRTALLDVQQTHMHSERHPYGAAMRSHDDLELRP